MATRDYPDPCENMEFFHCHLSVLLWKIFSPTFIAIGLSGNMLSIAVLSRKRMRYTTTSVYLRLLAIVDSSVLVVSVLPRLIYYFTSINFKMLSSLSCKLHAWLSLSIPAISFWLLTIIATDRLILVKYPIWAKSHSTRKSAVVVVGILSATLIIINSHYLAFQDRNIVVVYSNHTNSTFLDVNCGPGSPRYLNFYKRLWPVFIFLFYSILPLMCLIVCNVLLVRELSKRNSRKQRKRSCEANKEREQRDLRSVTKMLIVVCVFFIITSVPACIHLIIGPYLFDITLPHDRAKRLLVWSMVSLLLYTNNTVNFILYCLSARVFRQELSGMLTHAKTSIIRIMNRSVYPQIDEKHLKESEDNKAGTSSSVKD